MAIRSGFGFGAACVLAGGLCLSTGGILLRQVESAAGWEILFYRSLTFFAFTGLIVTLRYRAGTFRAFRAVGWRGLVVALALGAGAIGYVFSMLLTTVANTVFIIGASPLVTTALGWWLLRERVSPAGVFFMLVALAGIALMFADGIVAGRWLGNLIAVLVVLAFAVMLVALRAGRSTDMLPAVCLAGLVSASIAGFMAERFSIGSRDLVIALLLGSVQYGAGFILITIATRHISAPEVALLALSEAVLAPIWAWAGAGEIPSGLTLLGSTGVLAAVAGYCIAAIRRERRM